ncbi:unnamed protein product (macronuclear) [Paramecium tetraurelia]|uniref:Uncharacterized protein n=1 Tax=Paramecium tetraurelia TaxID=5888 RepID=A0EFL1_PARTE|nr:uncharacterized protein GSPATT00026425001 [Paramecium tetraurelia]CAK94102.1 unnamed protein product [Paramecium tetraurelia]|eukprot:XP_001461475.1 hypothetical protein (macronuclear) [Paramecium tetraurelia strain d4-2]
MNYLQHNNSSIFPLINQLPLTSNERYLYGQLYGINYQQQQQQQLQQQQQQFNPYLSSLNYAYQTNFIPAYSNNQKLPFIQSQIIDPLPLNYNLGLMVHQPESQIRLAFDLSDFGLPKEPPKPQRVIVKKKIPQTIYKAPEFDYFEQTDIPKIYLSNEQQFRIIKNRSTDALKKQEYLEREIQLERLKLETFRNKQQQQQETVRGKQQQLEKDSQNSYREEKSQDEIKAEKKKRRLAKKVKEDKKQQRQFGDYKKPSVMKFKKIVKRVQNMQWFGRTFLQTLENEIKIKKAQQQKQQQTNRDEANEMLQDWIDDLTNNFLLDLLNTSDSLIVQVGQDKQNALSKKKISTLLDTLSIKLVKEFKAEEIIIGPLASYLNDITQSFQFPPLKTYTKFEIVRIPTTKFGSLGQMNENCQKMILIIFIVLKQIAFNNIFKAWEQHPDQSQNNQQQLLRIQQNSIILSSIIHELVVKWVEKNVPIQNEYKLNELENNFQFLQKPFSTEKEQPNKEYPISFLIEGVMASSLIQKYINNAKGEKEPWIIKLEDNIQKFINSILQQMNKEYANTRKLIKRQKLSQMMINYLNSE